MSEGNELPDPEPRKKGRKPNPIPPDKQSEVLADLQHPNRGTNEEIRQRHGLTNRQLRNFLELLRKSGDHIQRFKHRPPRGETANKVRKQLGDETPLKRGRQSEIARENGISRQRAHQLKPPAQPK